MKVLVLRNEMVLSRDRTSHQRTSVGEIETKQGTVTVKFDRGEYYAVGETVECYVTGVLCKKDSLGYYTDEVMYIFVSAKMQGLVRVNFNPFSVSNTDGSTLATAEVCGKHILLSPGRTGVHADEDNYQMSAEQNRRLHKNVRGVGFIKEADIGKKRAIRLEGLESIETLAVFN